MPENTAQPFRGFFSAMEAMKKIDAICGEDWGGDEEIFRTNSDLQDLYATYKEGMREYRRGIGPDLVLGGNNEVLTDIMREMRGFREVEGGAKEYIRFSKDVFKILGHEDGVDIFDNLLSLKYFLPDDWLDRLSKGVPVRGKTLEDLLIMARKAGITGDHAIWFGDFVRRMGNSVLHETCNSKSIHARKALNVIGTTKEFIEHMY
jgi:hypothetical protein